MKREERAQQFWAILVLAANNRQILTYQMIAKACGVLPVSLGDVLRPIQQFCTEHDLPPLTSIVVNKATGLPGDGFIADADVPKAQARTFDFEWLTVDAPTAELFADAYTRAPDKR